MWLDLKGTELGKSGESFAQAEVKHQATLDSPVWGWSASNDPGGGYLGWGTLKDEVVTPHACVLAIQTTPSQSVQNLHRLESLGVRSPKDGFYDAYNWRNKSISKSFLILDQGMIFLSLANYLGQDSIRKAFMSAPLVRHGMRLTGMS
jgi:hypothetical protein